MVIRKSKSIKKKSIQIYVFKIFYAMTPSYNETPPLFLNLLWNILEVTFLFSFPKTNKVKGTKFTGLYTTSRDIDCN